jgi:hypothetical protein
MSTQTIGAMHRIRPVNNRKRNLLQRGILQISVFNSDCFYTEAFTTTESPKKSQSKLEIRFMALFLTSGPGRGTIARLGRAATHRFARVSALGRGFHGQPTPAD